MPFKNQPPLYHVWRAMRDRCLNPNSRSWKNYGGRGITICSRWDSFHAFSNDMGERPDGYTLDRIDNDQGYYPENCRWASKKQQQRNRRIAVFVEIEGQTYRALDLAEISGHKTDTIVNRAKQGLSYLEVICPKRRLGGADISVVGPAARKRIARERTHCAKGHEFTEKTTLLTKDGYKRCRTCHNAKMRRLNQAKREKRKQAPP